jgi:predicted component of type VI protein secretion system
MNRVMRVQNLKLALVADSGLDVGHVFPLQEGRQIIGRRIDANIPVDDAKVSRDHAVVDFRNGFFYLVDLGSTNGTYINGRRVHHAVRLNLGDHLRVGASVFRVDLIRKAHERASRHWHESTSVELNAFERSQGASASQETIIPEAGGLAASEFKEEIPSKLEKALSPSFPRWLYLIDPQEKTSFSKKHGLLLMILICSLLIFSAIFANLSGSRSL